MIDEQRSIQITYLFALILVIVMLIVLATDVHTIEIELTNLSRWLTVDKVCP